MTFGTAVFTKGLDDANDGKWRDERVLLLSAILLLLAIVLDSCGQPQKLKSSPIPLGGCFGYAGGCGVAGDSGECCADRTSAVKAWLSKPCASMLVWSGLCLVWPVGHRDAPRRCLPMRLPSAMCNESAMHTAAAACRRGCRVRCATRAQCTPQRAPCTTRCTTRS